MTLNEKISIPKTDTLGDKINLAKPTATMFALLIASTGYLCGSENASDSKAREERRAIRAQYDSPVCPAPDVEIDPITGEKKLIWHGTGTAY